MSGCTKPYAKIAAEVINFGDAPARTGTRQIGIAFLDGFRAFAGHIRNVTALTQNPSIVTSGREHSHITASLSIGS
jgi:hypothetical protein